MTQQMSMTTRRGRPSPGRGPAGRDDARGEGGSADPVLLLRLRPPRRRPAAAATRQPARQWSRRRWPAASVGSLLFVTDPAEINRLQRLDVEGNRHGIPAMFGFDVIHGLRTILPVPIAMAASWDPATIEQGQAVAAREARAVGIHWAFAPMVDIARDPRWGRIIEGAGEDPYLGGRRRRRPGPRLPGQPIGSPERVIAGPSTSPATAPPSAAATTTRSTSPTPSCGTSTSRRSRRRSRPAPATS